jgi:nucleotide-binding universal stress UspA family protein
MPPLTKILLPVDYSERCRAVARHAIVLAERFGSEITVLRVLPPVAGAIPGERDAAEAFLVSRRQRAAARLNAFVSAHMRHKRVMVISLLREGDPASEILNHAAGNRSDLIMMPTHGLNPFRLLLLGSVAAKCLHGSVCPIWIGPHHACVPTSDSAPLGEIVCAVVLGSGMSRGLEWAAGLASAFHGTLTVLHLAPRVDLPANDRCEHPWSCHVLGDDFVAMPEMTHLKIRPQHILLETGDISKALPRMAERLHADLLVLDRIPWDEGHLSIDAYAIIRSSSCSILRL